MKVEQAYTQWAATYDGDRNLTRDLDATVTQTVLAGLPPAALVVELGCGTGKNTAWLSARHSRVLALDFSAGMLRQAQARLRAGPARLVLADLTRPWPCAAGCAGLVVGNLVLEHMADLAGVFAEARRVLAPAGRLFLSELHPFKQYQGKRAVFEAGGQAVEIPAFVHHISDYLAAAERAGLRLERLNEWWHAEDHRKPPRLISFLFAQ